MFDRLTKTFSSIVSTLSGNNKISEKNIRDSVDRVVEGLLDADVPYEVVQTFVDSVKKELLGQKVASSTKPADNFLKVVNDQLVAFLGGQTADDVIKKDEIIMMMGLQGSGKTTTIGKLAYYAKKEKKIQKIMCASVDFYRPAAIDQLEILATNAEIDFYRSQSIDVESAASEIVNHYKQSNYDLLLLDTAGRMHVDVDMMSELKNVVKIVNPTHKLFVMDAMTGQESLHVAKTFNDEVGFDSAVLSKLDSDTRGGIAFAFRYALQKPIQFVGVGEKLEDLQLFHPERMASRMLGMGDLKTLMEKADKKIAKVEQERVHGAMMSGKFTLHDFASQLDMMGKLGSLSSIMKYIPGLSAQQIPQEEIERGQKELKVFRAIINSMTKKERLDEGLLNKTRKRRIAQGSGVNVQDVNVLLDRFAQAKQYAKLLKGSGKF